MVIPESSPDTTISIASDSVGNVPNTVIWSQWDTTVSTYLPTGVYTIIVDVDDDGFYDEEVDVIDIMILKHGAGMASGSVISILNGNPSVYVTRSTGL